MHNRLPKDIIEDSIILYKDSQYIVVNYNGEMYSGTISGKSMFKVRDHAAKVMRHLLELYFKSDN